MSEREKKFTINIMLVFVVGMILGSVLIFIIGLLNNNFFPKRIPTEIILTKSPLQITYKGNDRIDVVEMVKDAKDFPFVNYKFNENLNVKIQTEESISNRVDQKIDFKESSINSNGAKND